MNVVCMVPGKDTADDIERDVKKDDDDNDAESQTAETVASRDVNCRNLIAENAQRGRGMTIYDFFVYVRYCVIVLSWGHWVTLSFCLN